MDPTTACMEALWDNLEDKMPSMQASKDLWKKLLSSSENVTCKDPLLLPSIVIKDGTISKVEITNHEEILEPSDLRNRLQSLAKEINADLSKSRKIIVAGNNHCLFYIGIKFFLMNEHFQVLQLL